MMSNATKTLSAALTRYVTIKGAALSMGLSEGAVRKRLERGIWLLNKHYRKAPDGRIYIDMRAVEAWVESAGGADGR